MTTPTPAESAIENEAIRRTRQLNLAMDALNEIVRLYNRSNLRDYNTCKSMFKRATDAIRWIGNLDD